MIWFKLWLNHVQYVIWFENNDLIYNTCDLIWFDMKFYDLIWNHSKSQKFPMVCTMLLSAADHIFCVGPRRNWQKCPSLTLIEFARRARLTATTRPQRGPGAELDMPRVHWLTCLHGLQKLGLLHKQNKTWAYRVFTRSSKRPALARVFWIHLLEVCWTFAGSCKHPQLVHLVHLTLLIHVSSSSCTENRTTTWSVYSCLL